MLQHHHLLGYLEIPSDIVIFISSDSLLDNISGCDHFYIIATLYQYGVHVTEHPELALSKLLPFYD